MNTFFAPEKIEDLFNLIFPPITATVRRGSIDFDGGSIFGVVAGGGGAMDFGNEDLVAPFNLSPPKNVTAFAVLTRIERSVLITDFELFQVEFLFFSS